MIVEDMVCETNIDSGCETVSRYSFHRDHLRVADRKPGISAFMRIRNGADFLETTIRSHIEFFDEIVAVHNQCADTTPEILLRLQSEFGPRRLRVIHYTDRVFPPGSTDHARTSPDSPHSMVNYSNFALAATRHQFVTKLDDDHLAIREATRAATDTIRAGAVDPNVILSFSGLNLFRRADGSLAVLANRPVSGSGDIGFFRVTPLTHFIHDRRFERFCRGRLRRQFAGFLYWHLKFLKSGMGFNNYELSENPSSRFAKSKAALEKGQPPTQELKDLATALRPRLLDRIGSLFFDKIAFITARNDAIATTFPNQSVAAAIQRTVDPEFCALIC